MCALHFREDPDLAFLANCTREDLAPLVEMLVHDENGRPRVSGELEGDPVFKSCDGDYPKVWQRIAAELQKFGGDTLVTAARAGRGVLYRSILHDVAGVLKAPRSNRQSTAAQEDTILQLLIENALSRMTDEQKAEWTHGVQDALNNMSDEHRAEIEKAVLKQGIGKLSPAMILTLVQTVLRTGGFLAYQILVVVLNNVARVLVGRGLLVAGNIAATRMLFLFLGPAGWILTALTLVPSVTGPAYRVTIPAVVQIALLRRKRLG